MASHAAAESRAGLLRECRAAFDRWERFASGRLGMAVLFAWAVAEATVWPVIPDFLLVPMAAGSRRRFLRPLVASVLGSALGGAVLFLFAFSFPRQAEAGVRRLPLVYEHQIQRAHDELAARGAAAYLAQPWSGVAFKVWGVEGGALGIAPWQAIPAFVVGRAVRMAVFAAGARVLGARLRGFLRDFSLFVALIYLACFSYGWWQVVVAG
jgi:membrane protein YqaA with SNARE-associated domain